MADQQAVNLIHEENVLMFNARADQSSTPVDLSAAHLRGFDLRKYNLSKANLADAYLRSADLRGLNLSHTNLEGASLKEAKVSGVLFPMNILAEEIMMSLQYGTRLRIHR